MHLNMWQKRSIRRPPRPIVPSYSVQQTPIAPSQFYGPPLGYPPVPQRQVLIMKYTLDIYQMDPTGQTSESIFRDLDPVAFQKHSAFGRYSMSVCPLTWLYRSPAKRFIQLAFGPAMNHPYMQPNALRYVFCAINRTRNGKKIFLELPADLCLSVQVYQVLVILQIKDCIGPLHGHIKQIVKDRPLSEAELDVMQKCLEVTCPGLYWFAVMVQEEREEQTLQIELAHGEGHSSEDAMIGDAGSPDTDSDEQSGAGEDDGSAGMSSGCEAASGSNGTHTESSENDTAATSGEEDGYPADDDLPITRYKGRRRSSEPAPYLGRLHDEPPLNSAAFREDSSEDLEW
ncbi:hypothetical protein D6C90_09682 [Aureobasidium pullulans]|uniref:Uncharacterized protein n=1 Tax=Aureobasidium pullulans TaxID=5580 RepID=A0A4V4KJN3_AURPU|nr:hypothetical protein D6C90_09682 [Aureobasidium pullulans]